MQGTELPPLTVSRQRRSGVPGGAKGSSLPKLRKRSVPYMTSNHDDGMNHGNDSVLYAAFSDLRLSIVERSVKNCLALNARQKSDNKIKEK